MQSIEVVAHKASLSMKSEEIIIHCFPKPIRVIVDPGKHHPRYEQDELIGWICQGEGRAPVLKKYPGAKIMSKEKI